MAATRPRTNTRKTTRRRATPGGAAVTTVEEYFACAPQAARSALSKMRLAIRSAVPHDATETISYRMPAFRRDGVLVWYAAFRDHTSLFPGGSVLARFTNELAEYKTSKGTVQFPLDKPLPTTLIKKIVRARVAEQATKKH